MKAELRQRLLSAIDLALDLATLGEYGLETIGPPAGRRECVGRRRSRGSTQPKGAAPVGAALRS